MPGRERCCQKQFCFRDGKCVCVVGKSPGTFTASVNRFTLKYFVVVLALL